MKKKIVLPLPCKLTDQELLEASDKLSEALRRQRQAESEMETVKSQIKAKIQICEGEVSLYSDKILAKMEYRPVDCDIVFDFKKGDKTTFRTDTGEEVRTEKITEQERQMEMEVVHAESEPEAVEALPAPTRKKK